MVQLKCQLGIVLRRDDSAAVEQLAAVCRAAAYRSADAAREAGCALILHDDGGGLELLAAGDRPGHGVRVDFSALDTRTGVGNGSRRQPLGRAVGRESTRVVDATAGLGGDSVLLACMGYEVVAIERSPVLAAMLADGLQRARDDVQRAAIADRIDLRVGEARDLIGDIAEVDAVYVDPMFPPKRRASALPPKSVQVIRTLVGDDDDAAELVSAARAIAGRVVVKRPTYATPLAGDPSHVIESKLVRYDVYMSPKLLRSGRLS